MSVQHTQDYLTCFLVEQVRALRVQAGLSTGDIARALHVSEWRVRRWETSPLPDITIGQWADYAIACGSMPRRFV